MIMDLVTTKRSNHTPVCCEKDTNSVALGGLLPDSAIMGKLTVLQLQSQQRFFRRDSAAKSGQVAAGADNSVAGDDNWQRISAIRRTDRSDGLRPANSIGNVTV